MQLIKTLFKYYLTMIFIFFITRLALFIIYFDRFSESGVNYWLSFLYGLKVDTIVACMFLVIPLILLTLLPSLFAKIVNFVLRVYFIIVFAIILYIDIATFDFFAEYDVRPDFKFVEFLAYPKEVFGLLMANYKLPLLIAFITISLFSWIFWKSSKNSFMSIMQTSWIKRAVLFIPLLALLFIGIRSSFGHRPANLSDSMYSTNRIVNEIAKNSLYSIGYAIYANKKYETKTTKLYGEMDIDEALKRVAKRVGIVGNDFNSSSVFKRLQKTNFPTQKNKNLVIFLQESLGYQFVTPQITPNLLNLKKEGVWFDNLYSNGTRSIRGIAGITSGFLAVPGKGVVKRNKSQSDFFTFASVLKPLGYHTMFLYGGEARFDNMRSWFLGNGFDEIVEQKDYKNPTFVATWGVSDEDLANKANERFNTLYQKNQPFAALMFSSSNHMPFEIPDNRIELVNKEQKFCVQNAIKYADFAIGKFFEDAKKLPYYKDTVFVVVADHNVRVYGDDIVPINMFHIPALIIADDLKPQTYSHLSSQPDILATALDLLGKDFKYPILGNSIFSDNKQDINLLQFNENYALRVGNKVAVAVPNKPKETFIYKDKKLIPTLHDQELEKDVLAFIITLNHLYDKQLYR